MTKTCLLDLNYTLVANSDQKRSPFTEQIKHETYRLDLIDRLKQMGVEVILLTARPAIHAKLTLHHIEETTGWHPDAAYFNDLGLPPPLFKDRVVADRLLPFRAASSMFAVESNPRSRAMFERHGISAQRYHEFMLASAETTTG